MEGGDVVEEYFVVLAKQGKSLKPLREKFLSMGGFYNGVGYALPASSASTLQAMNVALESRVIRLPLGHGQTFEQLKQAQKSAFFRDKLAEAEQKMIIYRSVLGIEVMTEEAIRASLAPLQKKDDAIALLHECDRLRESLAWAENMERVIGVAEQHTMKMRSVAEISLDYFAHPPKEKPRLLYFLDSDGYKQTFLHKEITAMLVGEGGRGKTHLLAMLATSVATGIPFLGRIEVEAPGAVCVIAGENNDDDIHRLFFNIHAHLKRVLEKNQERRDGKHFGLHSPDPLASLGSQLILLSVHGVSAYCIGGNGEPTQFYHTLLSQLQEKEPPEGFQLIILDPASRFSGLEAERDNATATAFIACLEQLSDRLKGHPTIILAHHKSKSAIREHGGTQADARGASGLTDGVRWQANLSKGVLQEDLLLEVTKTNFTGYPPKLVMQKNKMGIPEFVRWEKEKEAESPAARYNLSRFKATAL